MLLHLNVRDLDPGREAQSVPPWISRQGGGILVRGDDSLERETYLAVDGDRVLIATQLEEIVDAVTVDSAANVSSAGVSHLLGTGFVPLPETVFDGVLKIGAGDTAQVVAHHGSATVNVTCDYPWMPDKSRQDEVLSTSRIQDLVTASLERKLAGSNQRGVLMLSSGKDSTTLAVALADLGYDMPCVTYRASSDNTEHEHAAEFCRRLGLKHKTIEMPTDPTIVRRHLTNFFERAVSPSGDHATIPYVMSVAESGVDAGAVIDGGGNDGYFGYIPSRRRRKKRALRIRGRRLQAAAARFTRIDSRINYLARGRSAGAWPGRNMRYHEIKSIYGKAIDPAERWRTVDQELAGKSDIDRAMANMIRQIEGARTPDKARLVAATHGMNAVFPYFDTALADYSFNLPLADRYDVRTNIDKIPLRRFLEERLGYDAAVVGDAFFAFDGAPFFLSNADFVREEIYSCDLWLPEVRTLVDTWFAALPHRPFLFHALNSLFALSGWHNHSPGVAA